MTTKPPKHTVHTYDFGFMCSCALKNDVEKETEKAKLFGFLVRDQHHQIPANT